MVLTWLHCNWRRLRGWNVLHYHPFKLLRDCSSAPPPLPMVLLVCTYCVVTFSYANTTISCLKVIYTPYSKALPHVYTSPPLLTHLSYSACILTLLPLSYHPLLSLPSPPACPYTAGRYCNSRWRRLHGHAHLGQRDFGVQQFDGSGGTGV